MPQTRLLLRAVLSDDSVILQKGWFVSCVGNVTLTSISDFPAKDALISLGGITEKLKNDGLENPVFVGETAKGEGEDVECEDVVVERADSKRRRWVRRRKRSQPKKREDKAKSVLEMKGAHECPMRCASLTSAASAGARKDTREYALHS